MQKITPWIWLKRIPLILSFLVFTLEGCGGRTQGHYPTTHKSFVKKPYNRPYKIRGKKYTPQQGYHYDRTGIASYYGGRDIFHGRLTSNGERFDKNKLTAAHKTLPIPSIVRVTNLNNGRSMTLKVNDRGPFVKNRIIDVSEMAAKFLGFHKKGLARVRVECRGDETMNYIQKKIPAPSPATTTDPSYLWDQATMRLKVKPLGPKKNKKPGTLADLLPMPLRPPKPHHVFYRLRAQKASASYHGLNRKTPLKVRKEATKSKPLFILVKKDLSLKDALMLKKRLYQRFPKTPFLLKETTPRRYTLVGGPLSSKQDAKVLSLKIKSLWREKNEMEKHP